MKEAGAPAGLFVAAMKGLAIGNPYGCRHAARPIGHRGDS